MRNRRSILSLVGLAAVFAATAALAPLSDSPMQAKVGEKAPDFTLKNTVGKDVSLKDFEGKIVVLQWINYDCPVCRTVMTSGRVKGMIDDLKKLDKDLVYLPINSTYNLDIKKTAEYLKSNKIEDLALIDQDGTVGKLYGAKTTPHLYVIDTEGVLRYTGALDDDQAGRKPKGLRFIYPVNAVRKILAGETVAPDTTRSYGCGVKYAR